MGDSPSLLLPIFPCILGFSSSFHASSFPFLPSFLPLSPFHPSFLLSSWSLVFLFLSFVPGIPPLSSLSYISSSPLFLYSFFALQLFPFVTPPPPPALTPLTFSLLPLPYLCLLLLNFCKRNLPPRAPLFLLPLLPSPLPSPPSFCASLLPSA